MNLFVIISDSTETVVEHSWCSVVVILNGTLDTQQLHLRTPAHITVQYLMHAIVLRGI